MPRKAAASSPHPSAFSFARSQARQAEALTREVTNRSQIRWDEETIIWGENDDLPLRQLKAVDESPTATSCLGTIENFIKGARFSEDSLMELIINNQGETLWDLHSKISQYMAQLEGFSVKFSFDGTKKITNAFIIGTESCRFRKPTDDTPEINQIKYNPYFGTSLYRKDFTREYPVFDIDKVAAQMKEYSKAGIEFPGQVYFYGKVRPLYRFYPVPKYWSGQHWIYVDGQIQQFHKENLNNGFFQSVWMQVVGDPNRPSSDPNHQRATLGTNGTTSRKESTMTEGEAFDERMASMFSGAQKAGTAFVSWVKNKDDIISIQAFPVNTNFDVLSGTFTDAIRGITIATEVPAILANLPQQASSLGSDGAAMRAAVELMQSKVSDRQRIMENFYNTVLLPNLQKGGKGKEVKIINYVPLSLPVTVEDKFWEFMLPEEKAVFLKENTNIKLVNDRKPVEVVTPTLDDEGNPLPEVPKPQVNEVIKSLGLRDIDKISGIKRRFVSGKIDETEVRRLMLSYGYTTQEIEDWLAQQTVEV